MKYRPSALEEYISTLPYDLQILSLSAVKEEHDRIMRGDLTPEEKRFQDLVKSLGAAAARKREAIALSVFQGRRAA
jgi:hypothetical protein